MDTAGLKSPPTAVSSHGAAKRRASQATLFPPWQPALAKPRHDNLVCTFLYIDSSVQPARDRHGRPPGGIRRVSLRKPGSQTGRPRPAGMAPLLLLKEP